MAELEYPRNTVWYLEARPKNTGNAPADPGSMGSAVVVELEREVMDEAGKKTREIKKYLLTCAHVVRAPASDGVLKWGDLWGEYLCFRPGRGYLRTTENSRQSGKADGVFIAKVSSFSPCGGQAGSIEAVAQNDWVLMEVDGTDFDLVPAVTRWAEVTDKQAGWWWLILPSFIRRVMKTIWGQSFTIWGYPGGAGFEKFLKTGHAWQSGDPVESRSSEGFRQIRTPKDGLLIMDGPDEARPGMSGGGVFNENNELVGIHRASNDGTMGREAVSIQHIKDWLWKMHGLKPVRDDTAIDPPWWQWFKKALIISAAALFLVTMVCLWPWPLEAKFVVKALHIPQGGIKVDLKTPDAGWHATAISDSSETTRGTLIFKIPAKLRDEELHLTLPDLIPDDPFDTYRYTEIEMPINLPPDL